MPSGPAWDALNWLVQQFGDVAYVGLAPPGSPPAALAALRKGFETAMADPEFIDLSIKSNGLPYSFVTVDRGRAIFKALAPHMSDSQSCAHLSAPWSLVYARCIPVSVIG